MALASAAALVPFACIHPASRRLPNGLGVGSSGAPLTSTCRRSSRALTLVGGVTLASREGNGTAKPLPSRMLARESFPSGFLFGASTSAYQVEGGANEGGKGTSIWDTFCKESDKVAHKSNGDVAVDSYHRYKEDVKLLSDMGMNAYRFSIAWTRILPTGSLDGGINKQGIDYYNNLINELIKHGIKPFVTLFHWDLPQALQDKYKGFLDRKIVDDFKDYAEVCFREFGDRVKHWTTVNEPEVFSNIGHGYGWHAPGRCSPSFGCPVPDGDSLQEPYTVSHNLILAHATAAQLYKDKFQSSQGGEVGIALSCTGYEPYDQLHYNRQAEERALDFKIGWYLDPLVYGDYPFIMRALVRDRLPFFTTDESEMIKGSFDFIGFNYYTGRYVLHRQISATSQPYVSQNESYTNEKEDKNGIPIGDKYKGTCVYPRGLNKLLHLAKEKYNNPQIYITENGICEQDSPDLTAEEACNDSYRQTYLLLHLEEIRKAITDGVNVKGHFNWSLMDSFEWHNGYTQRYGLVYVDYKDNLKRIPKASAKWYANFLKGSVAPVPKTAM